MRLPFEREARQVDHRVLGDGHGVHAPVLVGLGLGDAGEHGVQTVLLQSLEQLVEDPLAGPRRGGDVGGQDRPPSAAHVTGDRCPGQPHDDPVLAQEEGAGGLLAPASHCRLHQRGDGRRRSGLRPGLAERCAHPGLGLGPRLRLHAAVGQRRYHLALQPWSPFGVVCELGSGETGRLSGEYHLPSHANHQPTPCEVSLMALAPPSTQPSRWRSDPTGPVIGARAVDPTPAAVLLVIEEYALLLPRRKGHPLATPSGPRTFSVSSLPQLSGRPQPRPQLAPRIRSAAAHPGTSSSGQ